MSTLKKSRMMRNVLIATSAFCLITGALAPEAAEARKAGGKPVGECRKAGGTQTDCRKAGGNQTDCRKAGGNQQTDCRKAGGTQQTDCRKAGGKPTEYLSDDSSEQGAAEPPDTKPGAAEPPDTKRGAAEPPDTKPGAAEPPDTKPMAEAPDARVDQGTKLNGIAGVAVMQGDESEIYQELLGRSEHVDLNASNVGRGLNFKEDMKIWHRDANTNADMIGEQYDELLNRDKGTEALAALQAAKTVNLNLGNLPSRTPQIEVTPAVIPVIPERPPQMPTVQLPQNAQVVSPDTQRPTLPTLYPLGR